MVRLSLTTEISQLLHKVIGVPVVQVVQLPGQWFRLQKTAEYPQLQFIVVRRFSCRGAEADSHGLAFHKTTKIPCCSSTR